MASSVRRPLFVASVPRLSRSCYTQGMASTDRQRWARVPPALAWKGPGLPTQWVRVLDQHLEGSQALPGYVWLDMPGKVRHVQADMLEFQEKQTE